MYHYKNSNTGETVATLPKVWNYQGKAIMGITEDNMASFGWIKVEIPDPVPVEPILPEALVAKEQAFADKLAQLAAKFQIDLLALPDINIGSLLTAAQTAGASEADIANASAILLALGKDVEAESGLNWADTWGRAEIKTAWVFAGGVNGKDNYNQIQHRQRDSAYRKRVRGIEAGVHAKARDGNSTTSDPPPVFSGLLRNRQAIALGKSDEEVLDLLKKPNRIFSAKLIEDKAVWGDVIAQIRTVMEVYK